MQKVVEEYIERKKKELEEQQKEFDEKQKQLAEEKIQKEQKLFDEYKRKVLIEAGLVEKVYFENGTNSEYDKETGTFKHYNYEPIEVTDEEFEEICKYTTVKKVQLNDEIEKEFHVEDGEKENEKYFNRFKKLPTIGLWLTLIIDVIIGIVVAVITEMFGLFFLFAGVGLIESLIIKFLLDLENSFIILQTIYLKQIRDKIDNLKK